MYSPGSKDLILVKGVIGLVVSVGRTLHKHRIRVRKGFLWPADIVSLFKE